MKEPEINFQEKAKESQARQNAISLPLEEDVTIETVEVSVMEAQDSASINQQIATAKKWPRNLLRATNNALAVATMDQETAKVCGYSVPRSGKTISGPSVHLAKIIAQQFGNLRIDAKVIAIDHKHITSQAVCFDLENNLAIRVEVKRSIVGKNGRFSDDMITVTGNAANSIAMRNAIFSVIPRSIVDKIYNATKQMITGDLSDKTKLIAKRKAVVDQLKDTYGVTEKEILSAISKASIDHIDAEDIATLIGVGTAIRDGDTTIDEVFRGIKVVSPKTDAESK